MTGRRSRPSVAGGAAARSQRHRAHLSRACPVSAEGTDDVGNHGGTLPIRVTVDRDASFDDVVYDRETRWPAGFAPAPYRRLERDPSPPEPGPEPVVPSPTGLAEVRTDRRWDGTI